MFHTSRRAAMRSLANTVMLALSVSMILVICFATAVYRSNVIYHGPNFNQTALR